MKKKRTKQYKPRPVHAPLIVGASLVFSPLQAIIDQLDSDGTLTCSPRGVPMFHDFTDGHWYDTAAALAGVIEHLEMYETRHNVKLPISSMADFHRRISNSMPIDSPLMDRLRRDVPALQRVMAVSDRADIIGLYQQCQIKNEMEKVCQK